MLKYSGREYTVHWMILISIIAQSLWFFFFEDTNRYLQVGGTLSAFSSDPTLRTYITLKEQVKCFSSCFQWYESLLTFVNVETSAYFYPLTFFFFRPPPTILTSQTRFSSLFSLYVIFLTAFSASSVYQNWDTLINPGRYRRRRLEAGAEKWLAEKSNYGESTYHKQNIQKDTQVYQIIKIIKSYSNCDWLQVATDYRHPGHVLRKSKIRWYRLLVILGNISDFPDAKVMISSSQNPCY